MNIRFFFNNPAQAESSGAEYSIYTGFRYLNRPFRFRTNVRMKHKWFDTSKNLDTMVLPLYSRETGNSRTVIVNEFRRIQSAVESVVEKHSSGYIPDKLLNKFLDEAITGEIIHKSNLIDYYQMYIDFNQKKGLVGNTMKVHRNTLDVIRNVVEQNPKVIFDVFDLDIDFFHALISYFRSARTRQQKRYQVSTYNKHLKNIKAMMNWIVEEFENVKVRMYYKKVKYLPEIETDPVVIEYSEIQKIISADLSVDYQRHRDMFLFQMYTGQRHSALISLGRSLKDINEQTREFNLWVKKIKSYIKIPLADVAMDIYFKYKSEGKFPLKSNTKRNLAIKKILKAAGIDRPVEISEFFVGDDEPTINIVPLHDAITTHGARASFVTLMLIKGYSFEQIAKITKHTSNRMMSRYENISSKETSKMINREFNELINKGLDQEEEN